MKKHIMILGIASLAFLRCSHNEAVHSELKGGPHWSYLGNPISVDSKLPQTQIKISPNPTNHDKKTYAANNRHVQASIKKPKPNHLTFN